MPITAADLARLPQDQRRAALEGMSAADLAALEWYWPFWARPDQLPPPGDWRTFLLLGGRGSGKTRSASRSELRCSLVRRDNVMGKCSGSLGYVANGTAHSRAAGTSATGRCFDHDEESAAAAGDHGGTIDGDFPSPNQ